MRFSYIKKWHWNDLGLVFAGEIYSMTTDRVNRIYSKNHWKAQLNGIGSISMLIIDMAVIVTA